MSESKRPDWMLWATAFGSVVCPVILFFAYVTERGFALATIPYVDKSVASAKIEMVDKGEQIRKDAFEHSDNNRREMLLKIETMNGDNQKQMAQLSTKVDMVLTTVQRISDEAFTRSEDDSRRRRHK